MGTPCKTISVNDFITLTQNNAKSIVIDVRTAAEVNNEYFEGVINLPVQNITPSTFEASLAECGCETNEPVYLLCGSGMRAQKAAEQLIDTVSNPLVVIEGGISAMKYSGINLKRGSGSVISLERQVRIAAGSLVLLGAVLGALVAPAFYGLSAFVGAGLVFAGVTDTCAMGMMLARMPWNRA